MGTIGVIGDIFGCIVTFKLKWSIPNFSSLVEDEKEYYESPIFSAGDSSWSIRLYPDDNSGWNTLHLYLSNASDERTVTYTFGILRLNESVMRLETHTETMLVGQESWTCERFRSTDHHQLREGKPNAVTIVCYMKINDPQFSTVPFSSAVLPHLLKPTDFVTLSSDFKNLFISKKNCDVTIKVKNKEYQAHKLILATRSSVFAAMFEHGTSEEQTGVLKIPDCDPESFENFLRYIYTDELEGVTSSNAPHLYFMADKYDVAKLKSFCLAYMMQNFTSENVVDVLTVAKLYSEDDLMTKGQDFFNRNFHRIVSTSEWMTLLKENPLFANKLLIEMSVILESKIDWS